MTGVIRSLNQIKTGINLLDIKKLIKYQDRKILEKPGE